MTVLDTVQEYLGDFGLNYQRLDAENLQLGFQGDHTSYRVLISTDGTCLTLLAHYPARIELPHARLPEVLRLTNLLNATRIPWGAFWIAPGTQQLAFELALPVIGALLPEHVRAALRAVGACDYFFPAVMRVIWGDLAAEQALAATDQTGVDGEEDPADDEGGGDLDFTV